MSIEFENKLISEFEKLDYKKFSVLLSKHHIFVCGGLVDGKQPIPPSFRDRFVSYTEETDDLIHNALVLAENFKDYFKEDIFSDLLEFEDEIANLSTLVIIFLESPGSFVELGMFCSKSHFYKKLVIVAPQEETHEEESFIYLGPLKNIQKKDSSSVVIFPWPNPKIFKYDQSNLVTLLDDINGKLKLIDSSEKFDLNNSGHIALLVCEIIRLCHPILMSEIEYAFEALQIPITRSQILRRLYLLSKFKLINKYSYSGYQYYFPTNIHEKKISFGYALGKQIVDSKKIRMSVMQSFSSSHDSSSLKRKAASKLITQILSGGAE